MSAKEWFLVSLGKMDFILHCRLGAVAIYLLLPVGALIAGFKLQIGGYVSLIVIIFLWRFHYLAFMDRKRRIYVDDYIPTNVDKLAYRMMALLGTGLLIMFFITQIQSPESLRCGF